MTRIALGLLAVAAYCIHSAVHLQRGEPYDLLWGCHIAALLVGFGLLLRNATLNAIGLLWSCFGSALWLLDLMTGGEFMPTAILTHVGAFVIGMYGVRILGMPRRSAWYALGSFFALWCVSRAITPASANINLAFRIPAGWTNNFPNYPIYFLTLLLGGAATFAIAEPLTRRFAPPSPDGRGAKQLSVLLPSGEGGPELVEGADEGHGAGAIFKQILEYIHSTISEIRRAPKPFIAAVDGIAAAGGFGLAMSCDLVIASERATFEWAYSKTGLTGAESSTFMMPRLIGLRRAFELLFLNPRLDAKRALDIGLITGVHPTETFEAEVHKLAQQLAGGPTEALGIAKEMLNQAAGMDRLDFHLDRELENLARIADGANFAEGIDAFFEKRLAQFGAK